MSVYDVIKASQQRIIMENETAGIPECRNLQFIHTDTGETIQVPCNLRRCPHCGPRLQATLKATIQQGIGHNIHIHRYQTRQQVDTILATAKKRAQRNPNETFTYTLIGDDYYGYHLITDQPIHEQQRYMALADWWDRLKTAYARSDRRLRRSQTLSRLSLSNRKNKSGQTPWKRYTGPEEHHTTHFDGVQDWSTMAQMTRLGQDLWEEEQQRLEMWRMNTRVSPMPNRPAPSDNLPTPY